MTIIPKGKWKKAAIPKFPLWASLVCPGCGLDVGVGKNTHTIGADGTINPSMVCPHAPCTFHQYIRLEGWE